MKIIDTFQQLINRITHFQLADVGLVFTTLGRIRRH